MRHLIVGVLAAAALSAYGARAAAGGFEYGTDNGAVSVARGGASTAYPGDLSNIYTNVAGIADCAHYELYLSGNFVFHHLSFDREDYGSNVFEPVEDTTPIFAGPMLGFALKPLPWMAIFIGVNGPAAVGWGHYSHGDIDSPGGSRYDMTDMDIVFLWPSVGMSIQVPGLRSLRIGASFQPSFLHVAFTNYAGAVAADDPSTDVRAELSVWDPFVAAGQVGILYRIWRIEMGAQVRLSDSVHAEGELVPTEVPFSDEPNERPGARAKFDLGWPLAVLRFGVRYGHPREGAPEGDSVRPYRRELFDIELDFIYENNSNVDDFILQLMEPVQLSFGEVSVAQDDDGRLYVPHEWNDTFALRLGGSVNFLNGDLSVSLGTYWESTTVPLEWTRLDYDSWMRIGIAAGIAYRIRWFELTLGYSHIFMLDRSIASSGDQAGQACALLANAQGGCAPDVVVNAGDYSGSYDILAFSLGVQL